MGWDGIKIWYEDVTKKFLSFLSTKSLLRELEVSSSIESSLNKVSKNSTGLRAGQLYASKAYLTKSHYRGILLKISPSSSLFSTSPLIFLNTQPYLPTPNSWIVINGTGVWSYIRKANMTISVTII